MLTDAFRKINTKQNERWFQIGGNTFSSYISYVDQYFPPSGTILDLGAGSVTLSNYLPRVASSTTLLIAVDPVPNGLVHNTSRARVVANAESLPFRDGVLDVVAASCVFEHIEHPAPVISECFRTLKKGGTLVFYTPNRWSYVAAIARVTPLSFHRWIRMCQTRKEMKDIEVIKTFYRMNTRGDLAQYFRTFRMVSLETNIGHPSYTTFLPPPIHFIFILFHKIVQKIEWLRKILGETWTGCFVKP